MFMRRYLIAMAVLAATTTAGLAADLPVAAPPPAPLPPPVFSWTGFYIGGNVGGAWSDSQSTAVTEFSSSSSYPKGTIFSKSNGSGVIGGFQGGFNWQVANFVFGAEGEYDWSGVSGSETTVSPAHSTISETTTAKIRDIYMATGRVGYAFNNWLFYVKGGGAWDNFNTSSNVFSNSVLAATSGSSGSRSGWVVGGGIEWAIWNNFSVKIEYDHLDFGNQSVTVFGHSGSIKGESALRSVNSTADEVKFGLNYRFNLFGG
jgi:outer membrane immunogenic protein